MSARFPLVSKIGEAKPEHFIRGVLLAYVIPHLLEEGFFGFPAWAEMRWGIPGYTTSRWLIHNAYFIFFLLMGYLIYRSNQKRFLAPGLGILIWGLMNAVNHIVFSLIFLEYSPGLVSGLLFLLLAVEGLKRVRGEGMLTRRLVLFSVLFGLAYWGVPMGLFVMVDIALGI